MAEESSPADTTDVHQRKRRRTSDAPHQPLDGSVVHAERQLSQKPIPQVKLRNKPLNKTVPGAKRRRGERPRLPTIGEPKQVREVPTPEEYQPPKDGWKIKFEVAGKSGISVLEAVRRPSGGQPIPELPLDDKEDKVFKKANAEMGGSRGHLQIFVSCGFFFHNARLTDYFLLFSGQDTRLRSKCQRKATT